MRMFKISEFSKISRVSVKTLRYYDQLGLLKPARTDEATGYRYYTAEQLIRLHRILAYKDLGFTLEQIGGMLDERGSQEQIRGMLRLKRAELQKVLREETARLARIEARLAQIERGDAAGAPAEAVVKPLEPALAASVRDTVPRARLSDLFDEVIRYVRACGVQPGALTVLWHDCSKCDTKADVEVACVLPRAIPGNGRIRVGMLPGVPHAASLAHPCHPDSVCRADADLARWIESNGYRINETSPFRETFVQPEASGGELVVAELQIPVEPE
jgi:DNA-binding transcriptional MerR regulator